KQLGAPGPGNVEQRFDDRDGETLRREAATQRTGRGSGVLRMPGTAAQRRGEGSAGGPRPEARIGEHVPGVVQPEWICVHRLNRLTRDQRWRAANKAICATSAAKTWRRLPSPICICAMS